MLPTLPPSRASRACPLPVSPTSSNVPGMSTVTEIKQAVRKLPPRKKLALARWLETQVSDRLTGEEMMAIAAEGARVLDRRETVYAKRKTR